MSAAVKSNVKAPGSRGGSFWITTDGYIRYGRKPHRKQHGLTAKLKDKMSAAEVDMISVSSLRYGEHFLASSGFDTFYWARYEGSAGKFDQHTIHKFTWLSGPHKGESKETYSISAAAPKYPSEEFEKQRDKERAQWDPEHPEYGKKSLFDFDAFFKSDKIPGGLAAGKNPKDFDPKALAMGTEVELEHTTDRKVAREIAMDHLMEDKDYYKKLKTIEKKSTVNEFDVYAADLLQKARKKPYGHRAYTRRSKSGKISQIGPKGVPVRDRRRKGVWNKDVHEYEGPDKYKQYAQDVKAAKAAGKMPPVDSTAEFVDHHRPKTFEEAKEMFHHLGEWLATEIFWERDSEGVEIAPGVTLRVGVEDEDWDEADGKYHGEEEDKLYLEVSSKFLSDLGVKVPHESMITTYKLGDAFYGDGVAEVKSKVTKFLNSASSKTKGKTKKSTTRPYWAHEMYEDASTVEDLRKSDQYYNLNKEKVMSGIECPHCGEHLSKAYTVKALSLLAKGEGHDFDEEIADLAGDGLVEGSDEPEGADAEKGMRSRKRKQSDTGNLVASNRGKAPGAFTTAARAGGGDAVQRTNRPSNPTTEKGMKKSSLNLPIHVGDAQLVQYSMGDDGVIAKGIESGTHHIPPMRNLRAEQELGNLENAEE